MLSSSITRSWSVVWLLCASCRSWDAAPTYSYDSKSGAASGAGRSRAGARRWVGSEEEDGGAMRRRRSNALRKRAAADAGWVSRERIFLESLTAFKRAGARSIAYSPLT